MTDKFTPEKRSEIMSRIEGKNTKPEISVRSLLYSMGFRFRIHYDKLPGKPDICLPKYKTVIFVHGCYWHRHKDCARASMPKTNATFWKNKFAGTVKRDTEVIRLLKSLGWNAIVIWQCELANMDHLRRKLQKHLK